MSQLNTEFLAKLIKALPGEPERFQSALKAGITEKKNYMEKNRGEAVEQKVKETAETYQEKKMMKEGFLEILAMVAKTEIEPEKDEEQQEPEKEKKKRGRKPGSKNKVTSGEPKRRNSRRNTKTVDMVSPADEDAPAKRAKKPRKTKKVKKGPKKA